MEASFLFIVHNLVNAVYVISFCFTKQILLSFSGWLELVWHYPELFAYIVYGLFFRPYSYLGLWLGVVILSVLRVSLFW